MKKTKLAAIMFTDIVDYSRMMEADEQRTIAVLEEHNSIVFPLIENFDGEIIDAIGDGLMIIFDSVLSSCNCALNIQKAVHSYNSKTEDNHRFLLRIGIHLGDIWYEEGKVFGNGVNIAARLQPLAKPGGICISEDVYNQMRNKAEIQTTMFDSPDLKNIERNLTLYHLHTGCEIEPLEEQDRDRADLDLLKVKLLKEKEKIRKKKEYIIQRQLKHIHSEDEGADSSSFEKKLESRIYGFVEKSMDIALKKWDSVPSEKKKQMISEMKSEDWYLELKSGKKHKKKKGKKNAYETCLTGLVFGVAFGAGYFHFHNSWMIIPFILLGVLPFVTGLGKVISSFAETRKTARSRPKELERAILQAARKLGGTVTVVQLAAKTGLPLDEAQSRLDDMTKKGYVTQDITNEGIIKYGFPALISGNDDTS
jgi:class 3 adenylate cyclase